FLVGLDSTGDTDLSDATLRAPLALVLGAEGKGLRQLTRTSCDQIARLDLPRRIKSLNLSNAAALALYLPSRGGRKVTGAGACWTGQRVCSTATIGPIPKFASLWGALVCELRNRGPLATL